ncbi:transporter substrate-binding domain-containing protein [Ramlibacter sp. G-1-2-2]|uniref:Transporter substrate-binding domain-containing protein n=1 Tax=Ramlibacter agri TaxID=2728837 RepID=A0A848H950_9BURK|nr:transporter substrate-binding domain-containing protein [Ramlibacter agri]NML47017.1 transporter substrate-binding domain-containing protein [Ramlibacter agri]
MNRPDSTWLARRALLAAALAGALLAGCASAPTAPPPAALLAPTGALRIAVYPGSPTSLVRQAPEADMRGVSVDLGRALAQQLGVPARIVVYPRVAEVVAALQRGEADFTVTNSTAERARLVDFADPLVQLELGVLVPPGSPVQAVDAIDRAGLVIGVSQGSSSERTLGGRLQQAKLRTFPSLAAAADALKKGEIAAFATNKGILFELADQVPQSRVLPGSWGAEHLAPAIPKGREAALPFLNQFAEQVRRDGSVQRAADRAGLRGLAP